MSELYTKAMIEIEQLKKENEALQKLNSDLTSKCDYLEKEMYADVKKWPNFGHHYLVKPDTWDAMVKENKDIQKALEKRCNPHGECVYEQYLDISVDLEQENAELKEQIKHMVGNEIVKPINEGVKNLKLDDNCAHCGLPLTAIRMLKSDGLLYHTTC